MITGIRYFEVTKWQGRSPKTIVEYFGDYAAWFSKATRYRYEIKAGKELWILASDDQPITKYMAEITCLMLQNRDVVTLTVDLKEASNPVGERKPAMRKRR